MDIAGGEENPLASYRTRQDCTLQLKTDPLTYEAPGTYRIVVKAIDMLGNDTSQLFGVTITS